MEKDRIKQISPLDKEFERLSEKITRQAFHSKSLDFDDDTAEAKAERIAKALRNRDYFERTYFPPEYHTQGYYTPGILHKYIVKKAMSKGIHGFLAHRDLAKTAQLKITRLWQLLNGQAAVGGIISENLKKSEKFVRSIATLLVENTRLKSDFEIEIIVLNSDMLQFKCATNKRYCHYIPYSLESNPRGDNVHILRPDFIDADDLESSKNTFSEESNTKKWKIVIEAYRSCSQNASMIILGNALDPKSMLVGLYKGQLKGKKSDLYKIYAFKSWSDEITEYTPHIGSVWQAKFPASSESEMRSLMSIADDVEWSEAQIDPIRKAGHIFPVEFRRTYSPDELPADAFGPAYCDPNISLKGLGDTTAFQAILYSRSLDRYYIYGPRCRSYSDSNELLNNFFSLMQGGRIRLFAMDGHVSQESTWMNSIRNYARLSGHSVPPVKFCRYNVEMMATHFEQVYKQGKVYFPQDFINSEEGERYMSQFHTFTTKKDRKKDDAPDALICNFAFAIENSMFIANSGGGNPFWSQAVESGGYF